jgi:hypothetical protein
MTAKEIRNNTKNMTFIQACNYIESIGLELIPSENFPFLKSWEVKNHKEFYRISNYVDYELKGATLVRRKADVLFCFNEF